MNENRAAMQGPTTRRFSATAAEARKVSGTGGANRVCAACSPASRNPYCQTFLRCAMIRAELVRETFASHSVGDGFDSGARARPAVPQKTAPFEHEARRRLKASVLGTRKMHFNTWSAARWCEAFRTDNPPDAGLRGFVDDRAVRIPCGRRCTVYSVEPASCGFFFFVNRQGKRPPDACLTVIQVARIMTSLDCPPEVRTARPAARRRTSAPARSKRHRRISRSYRTD